MIVLDSEHDLRGSVVPTLDVKEAGRAVFAACSEIDDFDLVVFVIGEQNVLGLHIAMDYTFVSHELQALAYLLCDYFELMRIKGLLAPLVEFLIFVQIHAKAIEKNDHVLPEAEVVNHVDEAIVAFVVLLVRLRQLLKQPDLDIRIIDIKFLAFAYFSGDYTLIRIFIIYTFNYLPKCTLIDRSYDLVSIPYLLPLLYQILAFLISN